MNTYSWILKLFVDMPQVEMMSNDSEINFLKTESPMVSETVMCELMNVSAFEEQKFLGKIKFPKHSKERRMITYKKPKDGASKKLFQDDSFNKENSPNDSFLRLNDSGKQPGIQLMDSPGCLSEKNSKTVHRTSKMLFPDDSFNKENSPIDSLLQLNDGIDHHKLEQTHGSLGQKNPAAVNDFNGCMDKPQMIGDFSRMHSLPLIPGSHADLKCISSHTVCFFLNTIFVSSHMYPLEPWRDSSNRRHYEHGICIRHCQDSNSQPVLSQVRPNSTRPQWWTAV